MKAQGNVYLAKRVKAIRGYVVSCCKRLMWPGVRSTARLSAQFRRIAARREKKRAGMAVTHSILVIIYHLLRDGVPYEVTLTRFERVPKAEIYSKQLRGCVQRPLKRHERVWSALERSEPPWQAV